jgi:superfamily I DNA and RNA helicase
MKSLKSKIRKELNEAKYMVKPEELDTVVDKLGDDDVVKVVDEEVAVAEVNDEVMQKFIDQYGEEKGKQIYYATANKQDRDPDTFHTEMEESISSGNGINPSNGEEMSWTDLMAAVDAGELPISRDDIVSKDVTLESVKPKMTKNALVEYITKKK